MPFVNLFLDDELHAALKERAKQNGMPLYKLIPYLLTEMAYDSVVIPPVVKITDLDGNLMDVDTSTGEILPVPTKKSSLDLLVEERRDIDFGLDFKPVPKPGNGRKRAKTREKTADMSDNVE